VNTLRFGREIRWLFQAALAIFLVTIALGMSRGLGLIDFSDRNQLLTHLHSGAIGWVTLGILAAVLWLYGGTAPRQGNETYVSRTTLLLIASVPLYIVAWWTGNLPFRAITGALVLVGVVLYVGWLVRAAWRIGYRNLTTPQLGAVLGLIALFVGSTIGVLLQVQFATGTLLVPGESIGAHAETQVSAYLVLVGMSLAYWRLLGDNRTRRGTAMIWLFFIGGAIIAGGLLAGSLQLASSYIPLDIVAFILLLSLTWRQILAPGWLTADSKRHYAIAIPFAIVFLIVFGFIVYGIISGLWADPADIPANLFAASIHPLFVGSVTNILFGMLFDLNRDRRSIWPWADHVVFWGITLAVAAFTLAILLDATDLFKFITPVLGVSIFIGIVTHTLRFWSRAPVTMAPAQETSPAG
jgi:uncharacterized protein (DUF486 family)